MHRVLLLFLLLVSPAVAADTVEFMSGAKVSGEITAIRKSAKEFDLTVKVGDRSTSRTYPFHQVHAVTYRGKRFVLTPRKNTSASQTDSEGNPVRSPREIEQLIETVGASQPDWFDSTEIDYPKTLELDWPIKVDGGWNNQKNMGQYIWDVIHPNPNRWKPGIKLVSYCATLHQDDRERLERDWRTLGRMYFDLLQDYPRAAYWLLKAGVEKGRPQAVMLAECYWRMGNRQLAQQYLSSRTYTAGAAARAVKLYGNMGELDEALKMTQRIANTKVSYQGFIAAGDALREAGKFEQAIEYYRKVLSDKNFRNEDYEKRFLARARESIEAIELFERVDVGSVPDGTFKGQSTGYNGQLDVAVTVRDGRIEAVEVTKHREKQFYSAFTDTERSIVKLQTVRGVDGTSGATITSRAIVNATAKALADATP